MLCFVLQDDRYFLSGSLDGKIRLWNIPDKKVALWNELEGTGKCVVMSQADGRLSICGLCTITMMTMKRKLSLTIILLRLVVK